MLHRRIVYTNLGGIFSGLAAQIFSDFVVKVSFSAIEQTCKPDFNSAYDSFYCATDTLQFYDFAKLSFQ